jgi:hypothetical protein
MLFLLLAVPPALLMALVGFISAYSRRRTFILFSLCLVWLMGGGLFFFRGCDAWIVVFCLIQAAAGFFSWLSVVLRRRGDAEGAGPSPPSSPPSALP